MENNKLIKVSRVVTINDNNDVLHNCWLEVENGFIKEIYRNQNELPADCQQITDMSGMLVTPGFVQTHIHLCQTLFRGMAEDLSLLDWLQKKIFPFENAHSRSSLRSSAKIGLKELIDSGTTCILDMGTLRFQDEVLNEMKKCGIRGFSGKCLIDQNNLYSDFVQSTKDNISEIYDLAKEFHNCENGRVRYAFSPRFVLSCSEKLLVESYAAMNEFDGSLYHTHSSENKDEIKAVKEMTGKENIEYFESIGVLSGRTILAHCIHLNEAEVNILKENNVKVAHCPTTNLKLGSGIADIPELKKNEINVSLGCDGPPCNNSLNLINEIKLAGLLQKPIYNSTVLPAIELFRMATIDGARSLGLDKITGSVEKGKKADLLFWDINNSENTLLTDDFNIYSTLIYSAGRDNINSVMINGEWVKKDFRNLVYDREEIYSEAKSELQKLTERI